MKVLILGGGAREHALAWKLAKSPLVSGIFTASGNPGIARISTCVPLDPVSPDEVAVWALANRIDLVVPGPEAPLVAGVADALRARGIAVFGPSAAAARIEGSKAFAKDVMRAANIPTAHTEIFDDAIKAAQRARAWGAVVVKADGLAGGKGVVVADDGDEAAEACLSLARLPYGSTLLLEERLVGPEVSVIALCDGLRFAMLPPAQDHKRIGDGDTGPNTGGMGAYAPYQGLSAAALASIGSKVIAPALAELAHRGSPFVGALYAGLMLTAQGPKVLEFNCRFGDPETQPILMQLDVDLAPLLHACAVGKGPTGMLPCREGVAVGVVLAAAGYPTQPHLGDVVHGLPDDDTDDIQVFHGGTSLRDGHVVTAGGRVLTVCARGVTAEGARARAYQAALGITFEGRQFRRDIAAHAIS